VDSDPSDLTAVVGAAGYLETPSGGPQIGLSRSIIGQAEAQKRLRTNGGISYERSVNEAAQGEVRERLDHVTAGFDKEQRDVRTRLGSSPILA